MATNSSRGDLTGWRVNTKHFQLGKDIDNFNGCQIQWSRPNARLNMNALFILQSE